MATNGTNPGMCVDDYENMAVQNSNVAKRVAAGSAVFVGGAAMAGGAAYAANQTDNAANDEASLTEEDLVSGAGVGDTYKEETQEVQNTERVVYVDKPSQRSQPENVTTDDTDSASDEPQVSWDSTTNLYVGDEKVGSIEQGTINGHQFALVDGDGDNYADYLAVDMNNNGRFESDEIVTYSQGDRVYMGHETAHTTDKYFPDGSFDDGHAGNEMARTDDTGKIDDGTDNRGDDMIHNNFEDEKTGETYSNDYAQNNPDYNPNGQVDNYTDSEDSYLADNGRQDVVESDDNMHTAAIYDHADETQELAAYSDDEKLGDDYLASTDTDDMDNDANEYDSMVGDDVYMA